MIAPFPDLCLLVPFSFNNDVLGSSGQEGLDPLVRLTAYTIMVDLGKEALMWHAVRRFTEIYDD